MILFLYKKEDEKGKKMSKVIKKGTAHLGRLAVRSVFLCGRGGVGLAKLGFKTSGAAFKEANSMSSTFSDGGGGTPVADGFKKIVAIALNKLDNLIKRKDQNFNKWAKDKISRM